jgi:hypothetical protein
VQICEILSAAEFTNTSAGASDKGRFIVRRFLIGFLLPLLLCTLPFLAAALVLLCIPHTALRYFVEHFALMEALIVGGGTVLFCAQMILCWKALRWRGTAFNEGSDRWLSNLAQAAEWFPMLGLIGTVAGILEAFSSSQGGGVAIEPRVIAPAITATGAGLFMALINILPAWVVLLGRDMILLLSGVEPKPPEEAS